MAEEFAFESGKTSIAFGLRYGLGDSVIAKKVFDALIEIEPDCRIDIFYKEAQHRAFAEAFFGESKNLNRILSYDEFYEQYREKYTLAVWVVGTFSVVFDGANIEQLKMSPALLNTALKVQQYNAQNIHKFKEPDFVVPIRNVCLSRILNKNFFWFVSAGGALPIRDEKVNIALKPKYRREFDALNLGRYITIYSNIGRNEERPKLKAWPPKYLAEYVALVKEKIPAVEVVQVGGRNDLEIPNVNRHFLGCDLELTKYILANSLLHVGCEGGLVHLATALGTKCLVFFGVNDWHYYAYAENINIASTVCEPCMYVWPSGTDCLRGEENPPCMLDITPQEALDATSDWLKINA